MSIKLQFIKPHLSIKKLNEIELRDFTVITGINGSGKSHLLDAIANGSVATDIAEQPSLDIKLFGLDRNQLVPVEQQSGDPLPQYIQSLVQHMHRYQGTILSSARSVGLHAAYLEDIASLRSVFEAEEITYADGSKGDADRDSATRTQLSSRIGNSEKKLKTDLLKNNNVPRPFLELLEKEAKERNFPWILFTQEELTHIAEGKYIQVDPFRQSFSYIFQKYRDLKFSNDVKRYRERNRKKKNNLSDKKFREKYGPAPWDFVNGILTTAGLDFKIDHPELEYDNLSAPPPYTPKLTKKSTKDEVKFADLSSGEKVLMSLAFALYHANDRQILTEFPRLVLFDEIDAVLHPEMQFHIVRIIDENLVQNLGVKVILVTHAPTTVAAAPDDAIFALNSGKSGLHNVPKENALNILLTGLPTLALSYDGRRQVFVESGCDAEIYETAFHALKDNLNTQGRSLSFIPVSKRDSSGSDGSGGCDQVKKFVGDMENGGNKTVLGLIDWDGRNATDGRIHVLAHGKRYALENLMFDPVLLVALIRHSLADKNILKFHKQENFSNFSSWTAKRLQALVDELQDKILGPLVGDEQRESVSYRRNGVEISVRRKYLEMNGHDLQKQIYLKIPEMKGVSPEHSGKLMRELSKRVFSEHPSMVPRDLYDCLNALLSYEF